MKCFNVFVYIISMVSMLLILDTFVNLILYCALWAHVGCRCFIKKFCTDIISHSSEFEK